MKMSALKITLIVLVCLATMHLQADLAGDAARASAATVAAQYAYDNVKKMFVEIQLKRNPLSQLERATDAGVLSDHQQLKKKKTSIQQKVINMQQLLKSTQSKADQLIKKTNLQLQDLQPLLAVLQQANLAQEIATVQAAVAKLQITINDVSSLLKNQQAALANLEKAAAAFEP